MDAGGSSGSGVGVSVGGREGVAVGVGGSGVTSPTGEVAVGIGVKVAAIVGVRVGVGIALTAGALSVGPSVELCAGSPHAMMPTTASNAVARTQRCLLNIVILPVVILVPLPVLLIGAVGYHPREFYTLTTR